jgi:type III pantothenate kinase
MAHAETFPLLAVDVGNSRIKLGDFEHPLGEPLPHPQRATALELDWDDSVLAEWLLHDPAQYTWSIASVNRQAAGRLVEWLTARGVARQQVLTHADLPLRVEMVRPDLVGLDRLANAVAVNRLRTPGEPAVVIDLGSAITVDLIGPSGFFLGGAIMPGLGLQARSLHEFTDLLPLVHVAEPPAPLGKSTLAAISSGLYWGALGGMREMIARLTADTGAAQVFLTGGGAPRFASTLGAGMRPPLEFVPHLTLAGVALSALHSLSEKKSP